MSREVPILFSAPMVLAILAGRKTQTRRILKHPLHDTAPGCCWVPTRGGRGLSTSWAGGTSSVPVRQPYGEPGDLLWVRETWASKDPNHVAFNADGWCGVRADYGGEWVFGHHGWILNHSQKDGRYFGLDRYGGKWKPSIHLPKKYARIWLEVTGVRVERLQDITEEDAKAEGAEGFQLYEDWESPLKGARRSFAELWHSINGAESWNANPWVWVVGFKRTERKAVAA